MVGDLWIACSERIRVLGGVSARIWVEGRGGREGSLRLCRPLGSAMMVSLELRMYSPQLLEGVSGVLYNNVGRNSEDSFRWTERKRSIFRIDRGRLQLA